MSDAYVVRYGRMRALGEFRDLASAGHVRGDQVVIRSDRGTELGEVLCAASERTSQYMGNFARGEILRPATADDRDLETRIDAECGPAFAPVRTWSRSESSR